MRHVTCLALVVLAACAQPAVVAAHPTPAASEAPKIVQNALPSVQSDSALAIAPQFDGVRGVDSVRADSLPLTVVDSVHRSASVTVSRSTDSVSVQDLRTRFSNVLRQNDFRFSARTYRSPATRVAVLDRTPEFNRLLPDSAR